MDVAICGKSVIIVLPRERLRFEMKLPECKVGCPRRGRKKIVELPQTVKQQLKPKMPSFDIVESEFKPWWDKQGFIDYPSVSIKKVYHIIARYIGR